MKLNYLLAILTLVSSPLFGSFWADEKFPEKLIQRYPSYAERIKGINAAIDVYWRIIQTYPKDRNAPILLTEKTKELANLISEAARKEIQDQITEESEFIIMSESESK